MKYLILFILLLCVNLSADKQQLQKVKLQLQWKHQFEFAGFYAAKEKGFYKDVGLDVELIEYDSKKNIVEEVLSGRAQYALGYPSVIAEYLNEKPLVLLANFFKQSPYVLVVQKDIKTPLDLKGKKIMGVTGDIKNIDNIAILTMLKESGLDVSSVKNVKTSFNIEDFIDNKVDAMAVFTTNELYYLNKRSKEYNIFDPIIYGAKYYDENLFTSEHELLKHPQRVANFREASIKGWEYALKHPKELIEIILKKYNTQNKSKEALLYESKQIKHIMLPNIHEIGSVNKDIIRTIAESFKQSGFVTSKKNRDINNFIYRNNNNNNFLSSDEIIYLNNKKIVTMCIDPNWMPFEMFDDKGNHVGMTADYFKLFKKNLNIDIKVVKTKSWSESIKFVKDGRCDILSLVASTPSRDKFLNITSSYLEAPLVIATKPEVSFIDEISSIKDDKVAIVKDYAFVEILKLKYPNLNMIEVENIDEGLDKVSKGDVLGYIGVLSSIGYKFQTKYNGELKIAGKFNEKFKLGIGVRDDDEMLYKIFQKAIDNLEEDEKQEILNNWVSIQYEQGFDYSLFYKLLGLVLFVILFMIFRDYEFKKLNKELTKKIKDDFEHSVKKDKLIFQQNKMASLGEMVGNIAHQWRQPLARVSMIQNYLLTKLDKDNKSHKEMIEEIRNSQEVLQFMSKTIDTFQNFYKSDENKISVFDINKVVNQVLDVIKESVHLQSVCVVENREKSCFVKGELNALSQVILSIIQNSMLFFKIREIKSPKLYIDLKKIDDTVELSICDNAGGIDEKKLPYIFDYGYSNRDKQSNSTGVGLYISKLIMKEKFKSDIEVKNIKNGVCFKIFLKLYSEPIL